MSPVRQPVRRTGAFAVRAALALAAVGAQAAPPAALEPVVVVGTREPTALDRIVADVVVIDAQRIRDTSADSLEDLLRREGGIQLSRNGGAGQSASVLLRGNSASSVVVLVDGVRIGSATLGQADLAGISLAQVERIEVLRGPGSSLYGADAVGGVVNIVMRRSAGAPRAWAHAAAGSLRSNELDAGASATLAGIDLAATLGREASDGVSAIKPGDRFGLFNPDRDGFTRRSAALRAGVGLAPGHRLGASVSGTRLASQYDSAQFLAPAFLADATPDFRTRLATGVASIDYRGDLSPDWTTTLQASSQRDDMIADGGAVTSHFLTTRRTLTWQNAWSLGAAHRFVGAVEGVEERAESSQFDAGVSRRNTALVIGYTGSIGAQRLQADLRHDRNSSYGGSTTGKLGWSIELQPGLSVRAVAGTAFRAPTFNDLYFRDFGVAEGPFAVRPERSRSFEAGVQWKDTVSSASFTVYHNRVRDLIGYQPDSKRCPPVAAYAFGCAGNVSRARMLGATLEGSRRVGEFGLHAALDLLDAKDVDSGARLVRRAAHQGSVSIDWTRGAWSASAAVLGVGARPEGGATLASYETLDLQATWRFAPGWRAELKLQNALDRRYEPALDYQSTGRIAWLGLRFDSEGF